MFDIAQAFLKLNIALTTDEQAEADRFIACRFNQQAQEAGWDVKLAVLGTAPVGGLHFVIGDPATIKLKRGEWLSDTFAFLWSIGEAGYPHPVIFQDAALKRWETTLRQRVFWQRFDKKWFDTVEAKERKEVALSKFTDLTAPDVHIDPAFGMSEIIRAPFACG
jgi:hypothetical protein